MQNPNMIMCHICHKPNKNKANFCKFCGSRIRCERCKTLQLKKTNFCKNCGFALSLKSIIKKLVYSLNGKIKIEEVIADAKSLNPVFGDLLEKVSFGSNFSGWAVNLAKLNHQFLNREKIFLFNFSSFGNKDLFIGHVKKIVPINFGTLKNAIIIDKMFFDSKNHWGHGGFFNEKYPYSVFVFVKRNRDDMILTTIHETVHGLDNFHGIKQDNAFSELVAHLFSIWLHPCPFTRREFFKRRLGKYYIPAMLYKEQGFTTMINSPEKPSIAVTKEHMAAVKRIIDKYSRHMWGMKLEDYIKKSNLTQRQAFTLFTKLIMKLPDVEFSAIAGQQLKLLYSAWGRGNLVEVYRQILRKVIVNI